MVNIFLFQNNVLYYGSQIIKKKMQQEYKLSLAFNFSSVVNLFTYHVTLNLYSQTDCMD